MAEFPSLKVLDHVQISPPPASVPTTTLPLKFFDIPWVLCPPMQRVFFYQLPCSPLDFNTDIIPHLKTSLSLTLQLFFPFAATFRCPPSPPHKPYLHFNDGDSVSLTIAESMVDFHRVIADQARDVRELHPFVPKLPPSSETPDGTRVVPLLALQVTYFPNEGVCIGLEFSHVAADGMALNHFMKSWASIFKSGGELSCLDKSIPFHDRAALKDSNDLESIYLKDWWNWASNWHYNMGSTPTHGDFENKVRATFLLSQAQIKSLKGWVSFRFKNNNSGHLHLSTFVVACALTWVSLIKSQYENEVGDVVENDKIYQLGFVADCRKRLEFPLPTTYFGNCLAICYVPVKRSELVGENGVAITAKAIGDRVKELENGALVGAEKWMKEWKERCEEGRLITISGSPKLQVYETDFGWGRPKKTEVVQIDASGAIYLSESRDGGGGVEIGLAIPKSKMDVFNVIFYQFLKQI